MRSCSNSSSKKQDRVMTNRARHIGGSICTGSDRSTVDAGQTLVSAETPAQTQHPASNHVAHLSSQQEQMQPQKQPCVQQHPQPLLHTSGGPEFPSSMSISKQPTPLRRQAPQPRLCQQQPDVEKHLAVKEEPMAFPRAQRCESSELTSTSVFVMPDLVEPLSVNHKPPTTEHQQPTACEYFPLEGNVDKYRKLLQAAGSSAVAEAAASTELEQLYEGCDWRVIQAPLSPTLNAKTGPRLESPPPVWAYGCCESSQEKETCIADQDSQNLEAMESLSTASCLFDKLESEQDDWKLVGKVIGSLVQTNQVTPVAATAALAGAASKLQPGRQRQPL